MRRGLVLVVVLVAFAACTDDGEGPSAEPAGEDGPELAVDDATDMTSPMATIDGRLEVMSDCIVLQSDDGPSLTVWPTDTHVRDDEPPVVTLVDGAEIRIDGNTRTFVGGFIAPIESLSGCADRLGIDSAWLMARDPLG